MLGCFDVKVVFLPVISSIAAITMKTVNNYNFRADFFGEAHL